MLINMAIGIPRSGGHVQKFPLTWAFVFNGLRSQVNPDIMSAIKYYRNVKVASKILTTSPI